MQSLVNGLAVLAFVGVVILLFGLAALLAMVRGLQRSVVTQASGGAAARTFPELAAGGEGTFALVVSSSCSACRQRAGYLATLAGRRPDGPRLVLLTADEACVEWGGSQLPVVVDSALLGRVAPTATPVVVHVDGTGTERFRRLVGSDEELDAALTEAGRTHVMTAASTSPA